jgi:hypothetical protein
MSAVGTRRQFAAAQDVCRFGSEADMNRQARSAKSIANDPFLPFAGRAIRADDGQMEVGLST